VAWGSPVECGARREPFATFFHTLHLSWRRWGSAHPTREEETEACFLKALAIARKQQAKSLELRAATSLARLWQQQGKQQEAHEMLADIYGWFTEGFDTKDLQEARALIEELSH
jgi:predicted ATPase